LDKIVIKGLSVLAKHGVTPEEKAESQVFIINCKIYVKENSAFFCDELDKTIDYVKVCENIKDVAENSGFNLIERLSEEISKSLFTNFKDIYKLKVTVKKPDAPINFVKFKYVGVKIKRKRDDYNA
jgi:dihydroneopterin aldolase